MGSESVTVHPEGGRVAVTRAVIPAAGWGTRFLPATKAVPKEMLALIDRPVIEYAVTEAVRAGITDVVIVVSEGKEVIARHFAPAPELEEALAAAGKTSLLDDVRVSSELARIEYVVQHQQLGLGHAVATARDLVAGEPFAVLLPDEVVDAALLQRMIRIHDERDASVIGLMDVPREEVSAYGVPDAEAVDDALVLVRSIVEKPSPADAPSTFATIGRYVFTPEILDALEQTEPGVGGEIQLTDAIDLLAQKQPVYGAVIEAGRWDVGNKAGMLRASIELALARDDLGPEVRDMMVDICRRLGLV